MRWLIDGYNLIRRDPDLRDREIESLEAGRRALLHLLARAYRDPRDEFTVVFDGAGPAGGPDPRDLLTSSPDGRRRAHETRAAVEKRGGCRQL
jgi:hypothetical protein